MSSRISLQFSISIPQLSYGSSYKDNTRNGLTCKKTGILELQETSCKADISSQSDKEPIGGDFKQRYTQLVSKDRGSNKQVLQWTDVVMEARQIAIHRWIFGRSIFGNAFTNATKSATIVNQLVDLTLLVVFSCYIVLKGYLNGRFFQNKKGVTWNIL